MRDEERQRLQPLLDSQAVMLKQGRQLSARPGLTGESGAYPAAPAGAAEGGAMRRHRQMATVLLGLALSGLLALLSGMTWADTVHCTTREDQSFQRWVTECSDGSQAVTRYDEQVKRWCTEVMKPGVASQAADEPCQP
jgi:hypothetical protein